MAFEYLSNVPLDEAVEGLLAALQERGFAARSELVSVGESLGRVTAEPLYAAISAPHYHACAMDGIALAAKVTFGATATTPVGPSAFMRFSCDFERKKPQSTAPDATSEVALSTSWKSLISRLRPCSARKGLQNRLQA